MKEEYNVTVAVRTVKRRFQEWKVVRRLQPDVTDIIKNRIQVLFFQISLNDEEILTVLKKEGHTIGKTTLVRLRFELSLRRRIHGVEQMREAEERIRRLVKEELKKGQIEGYGRRYLHDYFRL